MRIAPSIQVTATERQQLEQWTRGRRTPARLVLRAAGRSDDEISAGMPAWMERVVALYPSFDALHPAQVTAPGADAQAATTSPASSAVVSIGFTSPNRPGWAAWTPTT